MNPDLHRLAEPTIRAIEPLQARLRRPVLVAIDGRSGAGKSALAGVIAERLDAAWVPGDDFFAAQITDAEWEARSPAARAADAIDWRRLRVEALEPLLAGSAVRWRPFDFASGPRSDGSYGMCEEAETRDARSVILLDGVYSTRPELADLIDLSVLVEAPDAERRRRLSAREEPEFLARWHARWDAAEDWYFTHVRPKSAFDLTVMNL
jgi:uridine kinase